MRFTWLDIKAFGPFSGLALDLDRRTPGLHVVYGPNEAGKSSSLRALCGLLYGIPERTSDNFVHPNDRLLIGGTIENRNGERLTFFRRKKRKDDLLDDQERPLPPDVLVPFLHGVDKETFLTLFGIDHERLLSGGREILAQEGHLGRSLFSAGTGISSLKTIHRELGDEADKIFKSRGSKQTLNLALAEYRELLKSKQNAALSSNEYRNHQKGVDNAVQELDRLTRQRTEAVAEKRRLERLRLALPELSKLLALKVKLVELGNVTALPDGFPMTRQAVQERRREITSLVNDTTVRLQEIRNQLHPISLRQTVLDHAREIETLNKGLERYAKDKQDRPGLEGNRRQLKRDGGDLLRLIRPDLPLEQVERLYPILASRKSLMETGAREELLRQVLQQSSHQSGRIEKEFESTRQALDSLPDEIPLGGLKEAVNTGQRVSEIDSEILSLAASVEEELSACSLQFARQRISPGDLDSLPSLSPPFPASLSRFAERFAKLSNEMEAVSRDQEVAHREQERISSELRAMELVSEVPTEKELQETRARRDHGWSLLRLQWIEGKDVAEQSLALDPDRLLPEAYEHLVVRADSVVDRLRREAERVHAYARLNADLESWRKRFTELAQKDRTLREQERALRNEWMALWSACGIEPLTPTEMIEWQREFEQLQSRVIRMHETRALLEKKRAHRDGVRTRLLEELQSRGEDIRFQGEELAPVLAHAESCLERLSQTASRRVLLNGKLSDLRAALDHVRDEQNQAAERFASWEKEWAAALSGVGLAASTRPAEVKDLIDNLQEIRSKLKEADSFRKRMDGIDRDLEGYEEKVRHVIQLVAPDLESIPLESAVDRLMAMLTVDREKQTLQKKLEEDEQQLLKRLNKGQTEKEDTDQEMATLLALAGCMSEEEIVQAEERWKQHREVVRRIDETELRLTGIGEGFSIEQLAEMAQGIDPDGLPGHIDELDRKIDHELEPAIKQYHEILGMERKELERMDGSGRAAEAAEQAEHTLARIRRLAESFVRLKLASKVLDLEIERFRAENQDPVLEIASRYFQELTMSSFSRLRADVNDQGAPVLIGVRPDNARVHVEGMSSGTRDQLYLALRLASLEWRMRASEPLPFIVDDILVNFDDARSEATMKTLAEFARSTQVILFTHHLQTVRVAETLGANILSLKGECRVP